MANNCDYNRVETRSLLIAPWIEIGGIMQRKSLSFTRGLLAALFVLMLLPLTTFAQRRWVVVRPRRSRVVVYQPRSYVTYQQPYYSRQYYSYPYQQPYYSNNYYSYGYTPYNTNSYYSYGYTQPYYVNRYTYSTIYPSYNNQYRSRYRRSRFRVGIWLR
jgi:hypothetical protein